MRDYVVSIALGGFIVLAGLLVVYGIVWELVNYFTGPR
jgi:hypothetical protein